jgi:molybdate transport system ATP-binding protein
MPESQASGLRFAARQTRPIPLSARFACEPGELLALVGPSGSGKTTILRCIAGLHRPPDAAISCNGESWADTQHGGFMPPQRRRVGMVFQHYALFPHLSALANVAAPLAHLTREARAAKAREWLARVHLDGLEARRPAELSGGQQQRVALARALAREPAVLLLDEPFSAVDQVTRRKLVRELAQMRVELRMPIVLVTHDLSEARMLADQMCILHHGAVLQAGPPDTVLARPCSVQVARQIDTRNIFAGKIGGHDAAAATTWIEWQSFRIEAHHRPEFPVGAAVAWMMPSESVILHRRDRSSRGEHENPVQGVVSECVKLGEITQIVLRVDPERNIGIAVSLPTHVAQRNNLAVGVTATVSLLKNAIHLMPPEDVAQ